MYNVKHGGEVHRGDLVGVCWANDLVIGIYFGNGRGGTFQYYVPRRIAYCRNYFEEHKKAKEENGLPDRSTHPPRRRNTGNCENVTRLRFCTGPYADVK